VAKKGKNARRRYKSRDSVRVLNPTIEKRKVVVCKQAGRGGKQHEHQTRQRGKILDLKRMMIRKSIDLESQRKATSNLWA